MQMCCLPFFPFARAFFFFFTCLRSHLGAEVSSYGLCYCCCFFFFLFQSMRGVVVEEE